MAQITDTGAIPTTLTEYQDLFRAIFRAAFGEGIDLDAKSPQGQFIDNLSLSMSQNDDAIISSAGALNIFTAFLSQLDGIAAALGITKDPATGTIVSVALGGTPATVITEGSRARSDGGDLCALNADVTLDALGVGAGIMTTVETGPIIILAGELTQVVDVVPGWETVTNAADGAPGQDAETDVEFRQKYFTELFKNAVSVLDSIVAAVSAKDNIIEVAGYENDTSSPVVVQNVTIDPHSVAIIVDGGLGSDIADAIRLKKTGGTATTGTTAVSDPPNVDINYFIADIIDAEVSITTTPGTTFPNDGLTQLKQRVFDYVNGNFAGAISADYFESDGMKISEDLDKQRLYTPINSVPGHLVSVLQLEDKASPGDVAILTTDLIEKIKIDSLDDVNVTLL